MWYRQNPFVVFAYLSLALVLSPANSVDSAHRLIIESCLTRVSFPLQALFDPFVWII